MEDFAAIFGICFVCASIIIVYGTIRCKMPGFTDPLTYSAVPAPWNRFLDGWGIAHFLFYGMLGYLYPARWLFITCLGILWELIEMQFKDHPFYLSKCSYDVNTDAAAGGAGAPGWWYGRWEDIVMNTGGMLIGIALARRAA
jgi:hypothetical protein